MSLILSGTDGLSDVDGSAATPAIRGTDTNTGIFFPAADTIAFAEGGAEVARFDSAGNFGVGTTSPAFDDGTGMQLSRTGTATYRATNTSNSVSLEMKATNSLVAVSSRGSYPLIFETNGSEKARITSGGFFKAFNSGSAPANTQHEFITSTTNEVTLRMQSTAASPYGGLIYFSGATPNNTTNYFLNCFDTTTRFQAMSNGGVANFSGNNINLSDRREKTNFSPAKSYLDVICAIPVQTFNYIDQNLEEDDGLTLGVVAQDVQAVAPELVMESNWAGKDEEPKMRLSIYQTDLQYALMKCIQEQQALIAQLQADVAALKGNA